MRESFIQWGGCSINMANVDRLTKRVKGMEEWIEKNGSGPTLNNMNYLLDMLRNATHRGMEIETQHNQYRALAEEFFSKGDVGDEWNEFLKEKENAVQKQQTEEVSVQEEAESSEEVIEAQEEEE